MTLNELLHKILGLPKSAKVYNVNITIGNYDTILGSKIAYGGVSAVMTFNIHSTRLIKMDRTLSCFCSDSVKAMRVEQLTSPRAYDYKIQAELLAGPDTVSLLQEAASRLSRTLHTQIGVL